MRIGVDVDDVLFDWYGRAHEACMAAGITGMPHLASVAWHAFALLQFMNQHPDFDDRPR